MPKIRMPDGKVVAFPDDMPAAQIKGLIAQKYPREVGEVGASKPLSDRDTAGHYAFDGRNIPGYDQSTGEMAPKQDTFGAFLGGVRRGAEATVGGFGDISANNAGLLSSAARVAGLPEAVQTAAGGVGRLISPFPFSPSTQDVRGLTNRAFGGSQQPSTKAEKYAGTMGEFAPAVFGPGGFLRKFAMMAIPSTMSESAGQATEGTPYEPYARLGAGFAGSIVSALPVPSIGAKARNTEAISALVRDMQAAGRTPDEIKAALSQLGDDAALIDLPEFQQRGQRIYAAGGEGRQTIGQFLEPRHEQANARIRSTVDDAFGPAPIPSRVESEINTARKALSPEYERVFANAKAVDTAAIADDIASMRANVRGAARSKLDDILSMLKIEGTDVLDPHPRALHAVREAIDGMMAGEADGNVRRIIGNVRANIDKELAAKVPGIKAVDAKYAGLMRESEAFARGQTVLDSGRSTPRPVELADDIAAGGPAVKARLAQGARADIDRLIGTNANDRVGLQRAVKGEGDWNRDKIGQLFGSDNARAVFDRLDTESVFQATVDKVMRNSNTAERLTPGGGGLSIRDAAMAGGPKAVAYSTIIKTGEGILKRLAGRAAGKTDAEIAKLLTTSERNAIFMALLKGNGGGKPSPEQLNMAIRLAVSAPSLSASGG